MSKCDHCVVPSPTICRNEFTDRQPNQPSNPYRLKIFPIRFDNPPNSWCEDIIPALGDYIGAHRTGGNDATGDKSFVLSGYIDGTSIYPTFLEMLDVIEPLS